MGRFRYTCIQGEGQCLAVLFDSLFFFPYNQLYLVKIREMGCEHGE